HSRFHPPSACWTSRSAEAETMTRLPLPPVSSIDPSADWTVSCSWCSVAPSSQRTSTVPRNETWAAAARARSKGSSTNPDADVATDVVSRPATSPATSTFTGRASPVDGDGDARRRQVAEGVALHRRRRGVGLYQRRHRGVDRGRGGGGDAHQDRGHRRGGADEGHGQPSPPRLVGDEHALVEAEGRVDGRQGPDPPPGQ